MKKKFIIPIILLLTLSCSLSQNNQFRLGFTGMFPSYYDYSHQIGINWNYYHEMNTNLWQGWWVGTDIDDTTAIQLQKLSTENIDGFFQPDTIRWAALGRVQINYADSNRDSRFKFNNVSACGQPQYDASAGGYVLYFDKNCATENMDHTVLWGVKENCMQTKNNNFDPEYQVSFPYNDYYHPPVKTQPVSYVNFYHIEPRMRINANVINSGLPVVKIIVTAFNGDVVLATDIFTNDFGNGSYQEDFPSRLLMVRGDSINRGRPYKFDLDSCHVDYQVYWYGQVSFWIDYVKVMDEAAYDLLNPLTAINYYVRQEIQNKVNNIMQHDAGGHMRGFYLEEVDYSNLACIAFLNKVYLPSITNNNPNYKVIPLLNTVDSYTSYIKNNPGSFQFYYDLFDSCNEKIFMTVKYPFVNSLTSDYAKLPSNINYNNLSFPTSFPKDIIKDIQKCYTDGISSVDYNTYNTDLQGRLENYEGYLRGVFNPNCKQRNMDMYCVPQIIFWHFHHDDGWMREPMTSEIGAEIGIDLCNGAKGILPYAYESWHSGYDTSEEFHNSKQSLNDNNGPIGYHYDLSLGASDFDNDTNWGCNKRERDVYGEYKWDSLQALYSKIQSWGQILYGSTNTNGWSFVQGVDNNDFVNDIESIDPATNSDDAVKYWEMGIVNYSANQYDHSKYVLFCNRRCVPAINYHGDNRVLKIKFNGSHLLEAVNWVIRDLSPSPTRRSITFSRNNNGYIDIGSTDGSMGWFHPGETKLFKITPVTQTGGILTDNEIINGEFNCEDTIFNNGYSITINNNSSLHFTDTSTIIMNGGTFLMGNSQTIGSQNMGVDAVQSNHWHGFTFQNCNVQIYGATFSNVLNDTTYAMNLINCPLVDIRYCTFNNENGDNIKGGISAAYYYSRGLQNIYIGENTFNINQSALPELSVMSYAGSNIPLVIENNSFSSQNSGSTAMLLSGVTGGAVKSNSITDCGTGINLLSSSVDIYNNTITVSSFGNCTGIFGASGSDINMSPSAGLLLGGSNNISASQSSIDIDIDNSFFFLDQGANLFNIADAGSWHLYGTFPSTGLPPPTSQTNNCFKLSGTVVDPPYNYVTSMGQQVTFTFDPYLQGCSNSGIGTGSTTASLGNGINDTIKTIGGGSGGGSSASLTTGESENMKLIVLNAKKLYDSLCVQMRFRHYSQAKNTCYNLVNTYTDSVQTVNAISKLFLSSIGSGDTSQTAMTNLKTFYENLILNNSGNLALVKRCNYFVQKCKVRLRDYTGALNGFQQIINQNPTSYEALVARWDFMAATLLMNGGGGGESSIKNYELEITNDNQSEGQDQSVERWDFINDPHDKFSKEQRQAINSTISTALVTANDIDNAKIEKLKQDAKNGSITAAKELKVKTTLKEIVGAKDAAGKTQRPKNIIEHLNIVRHDINKLFGKVDVQTKDSKVNIPTSFALYQNYPNPFNPVTKIMYDLPNAAKVKITVYDLLGREVIKLVNNELKQAGRYYVDFNGNNFASGVYFYKIEADKFVQAKKMILIK